MRHTTQEQVVTKIFIKLPSLITDNERMIDCSHSHDVKQTRLRQRQL